MFFIHKSEKYAVFTLILGQTGRHFSIQNEQSETFGQIRYLSLQNALKKGCQISVKLKQVFALPAASRETQSVVILVPTLTQKKQLAELKHSYIANATKTNEYFRFEKVGFYLAFSNRIIPDKFAEI